MNSIAALKATGVIVGMLLIIEIIAALFHYLGELTFVVLIVGTVIGAVWWAFYKHFK